MHAKRQCVFHTTNSPIIHCSIC